MAHKITPEELFASWVAELKARHYPDKPFPDKYHDILRDIFQGLAGNTSKTDIFLPESNFSVLATLAREAGFTNAPAFRLWLRLKYKPPVAGVPA